MSGLPKTTIKTIREVSSTSSIYQSPDSLNVKPFMKAVYLIDSSTKFFHKIFGASEFCKEAGEVILPFYAIEQKKITDFFKESKVTATFFSDSKMSEGENSYFLKIPDPVIDELAIDWENINNEIAVYDDIYYVVNLTNKNYENELSILRNNLAGTPYNKNVMVIDKVATFAKGGIVASQEREKELYDVFNSKEFKTVYYKAFHSKFINAQDSNIHFWEVGDSITGNADSYLTGFTSNPASDNGIVRFFIPPVKLFNKTFGITDAGSDDGLIDLQGIIPMFFIGRRFEQKDKQEIINKDSIECISEVNSSDELFLKISDSLTSSKYRISVLCNGDDGVKQGRIKYARTLENVYKELEEVSAIETSDAITILLRNQQTALIQRYKTINSDNMNSIELGMRSFVAAINESSNRFVESVTIASFGLDAEYPDIIVNNVETKLRSMLKDVSVILRYAI